ncbi:Ribosomal protein L6, subgroup [mine drainage metagenome]|uniref:Ribosomal protein L6, subgroup n=1 Tax=mine drainage metagenome TaxID=410659 RepID=T1CXX5_9ZZZZ
MSRVGKNPIAVPKGVTVHLDGSRVEVRGPRGALALDLPAPVSVDQADSELRVHEAGGGRVANALSGTIRSILSNMVRGVSQGFERRLELTGVGYRAQMQGKVLQLALGYSKPILYPIPSEITVETPSQTEIVVRGCDRQRVGQIASEIRSFRRSDPYKGKGVRYAGEVLKLKETKKK